MKKTINFYLLIKLEKEHKNKEIEIGQIKIQNKSLQFGKITDKIYYIKNWCIHLILEINDFGEQSFSDFPCLDLDKIYFYVKHIC